MSLAKRVRIIEKHFTLDHDMPGWDHKVSADPDELRLICKAAKCGEDMLGTTQIVVNEDEERRHAFQRSIVAAHDIPKGTTLSEKDIDYKRPGTGVSPNKYQLVIGRTVNRDLSYDEIIELGDLN
jgi:N-acetylneuraminate synthase